MLTVSRSDVETELITEFDPATRFIKLPIVAYMKLLPAADPTTGRMSTAWDLINRPQIALINALNNPKYRFVCAALARRLGKTYIANVIAQLVILVPDYHVLIISPNYNLSSISFELQRRLLKSFDIEVTKDNVKDKVIEVSNGSTVRMGSVATVDSCVGRSYNLILFDEAALGSDGKDAFNVSLRPTLDRPNSKAVFISTPRGKNNWFSEFYQRGFSDEFPEWCSLTADYTENDRMREADVLEAKSSMSEAEFKQEYLASFSTFEGQIFAGYDSKFTQEFEVADNIEYLGGLDPGYKDPTAFVVIAYNSQTEIFHIIDEYQESEAVTSAHADKINELIAKYGVDSIFIDSAAAQFASDLAYMYDIATIKAKKEVLPGIAHVQTLIETGKIRVSPNCTHTLEMLDQYQWDNKTGLTKEKPKHDNYSHMADALRYALYSFIP